MSTNKGVVWAGTMEYEIPGIPYSVLWILRRKNSGSRSDLQENFATFPVNFPTDFPYGKLTGKVTNGEHVTVANFISVSWLSTTQIHHVSVMVLQW